MEPLCGRGPEKKILLDNLYAREARLIAIYGRRRVGKTFLIRSVYKDTLVFECSGIHGASLKQQLQNFSLALQKAQGAALPLAVPGDWLSAFQMLEQFLTLRDSHHPAVVFFDELPWLHGPRSGFLSAFGHFWNTWASRQSKLIVVICGSAASWMIKHIINNKGGLHQRINERIRLEPFTLTETEAYLEQNKVRLDRYQLLQLYMAIGGIPPYLQAIKPGESAAQAIDRICFTKNGILTGEFTNLYQSLFDEASHHMAIVRELAKHGGGLNRNEIIEACRLSSGGTASVLLDELTESGFINKQVPYEKSNKDSIYKLSDEYSLFYLKFMDKRKNTGDDTWLRISESPSGRSWAGYAFEAVCLKHVMHLKKALGIDGMLTTEATWRFIPGQGHPGAQIDLLIDRADHTINICEIKYARDTFSIDTAYAAELRRKVSVFREKTKTKKTLFLTMITTYGVSNNTTATGLIQKQLTMDDLF